MNIHETQWRAFGAHSVRLIKLIRVNIVWINDWWPDWQEQNLGVGNQYLLADNALVNHLIIMELWSQFQAGSFGEQN